MNKILKNTLILTLITVIAGTALGIVYEVTKEPIAAANENAKQVACQKVFPEADQFEAMEVNEDAAEQAITSLGIKASIDEVYAAKMGDSEIGYVITATDEEGFGGDIQITVGMMKNGSVSGVSILSISETAGLGMNATESSFLSQYAGQQTEGFYVSKDGGEGTAVDALSGATITTRAVTGAVNAAVKYYQNALGGSANE